jgi:hypothetical protein
MTIEISLVELQLHVAAALATHGIGAESFEVRPDAAGGWRIELIGDEPMQCGEHNVAVRQVEESLRGRYKVHRLSLGGAYGG